jgi:hypothetical protein
METSVIMKLRVANRNDFADQVGNKKIGVLYFQQSYSGNFCTQPYYFSNETNLETFRELFATKQIWVPMGIFDEIEIIEVKEKINN